MKNISRIAFILTIAVSLMAFSFPKRKVLVTCELNYSNATDSLYLFVFDGLGFDKLQSIENKNQKYIFQVPKSKPSFYYIGTGPQKVKSIILGSEPTVSVKGSYKDIRKVTFDSKINNAYNKMMSDSKTLRNKSITERGKLVKAMQSGKELTPFATNLKQIDIEKTALLERMKATDSYLGNIASLYTYLSFHNNRGNQQQEIDYFGKDYFKAVDFKADDFNRTATVYDAVNSYTTMLSKAQGVPLEQIHGFLDALLNRIPENNKSYKMALGAMVSALGQKSHPAYSKYAKIFLAKYKNDGSKNTANLQNKFDKIKNLMMGEVAPDFKLKDQNGKDLSLTDLRGKYLLLDFWASWCGPCRKENPNVVAVYNKYKSKGFEILSISLDKSADRWNKAIIADQLDWYHVSDLKGWSSSAAKLYNVHSVPYQMLLDPEGKIIAKGMRAGLPTNSLEYHLAKNLK